MLQVVVYGNSRPGASRIDLGQFVVHSARFGRAISPDEWHSHIKAGDHVFQQAMILYRSSATHAANSEAKCLYTDCDGRIAAATDTGQKDCW